MENSLMLNLETLRNWAPAHAARYRDRETFIRLEDHFRYCDDGNVPQGGP